VTDSNGASVFIYDDLSFTTEPSTLGTPYCFGDGSGTACPCANNSPVGALAGCLSSLGIGAKLEATGTASIATDTATLHGSQMPDRPILYFQGTTQTNRRTRNRLRRWIALRVGDGDPLEDDGQRRGRVALPASGDPTPVGQGSRRRSRNPHVSGVVPQRRELLHSVDVQLDQRVQITWVP
jgi:hypothetical protein